MRFIADFHIHSHYSRATSKEMNVFALSKWACLKGVNVIGTGDFTHPLWLKELREKLEPAEPGLFKLKKKYEKVLEKEIPLSCDGFTRFVLSVEISSIYKKNNKVRKVHNLVLAPSFKSAAKINTRLGRIGNLSSDGRPILGLDSKELLKIVLDISEDCMLIPAHIWTPHFAVFGSRSGFNSLEECFDELTPFIYAVETGLSSDPAMNWRIKELDNRAIISNSDAHSPGKLGREANIFETELSYYFIIRALKNNDPNSFKGTIEFYPEEGKYHLDGHRNCRICFTPQQSRDNNFLCSACSKPVTLGVMYRVEELADRDRSENFKPINRQPFYSIIPLPEVISNVEGVGPQSKKVQAIYMKLLQELGNEFFILLETSLKEIRVCGGARLAEAINRMRQGKVNISAGYDGLYGKVEIFKS